MTLREVQALLVLYRGCLDQAARRRALELVPDLAELVEEPVGAPLSKRYRLTASIGDQVLMIRETACAADGLDRITEAFLAEFNPMDDVRVTADEIS